MISTEKKLRDYIKFIYPLCLYSFLQQIYGLIDVVNGSQVGAHEMSYIVYMDQVMLLILAFANSIVIGISVLISKRTEEGKTNEIRQVIGNATLLLIIVSIAVLFFIVFFNNLFLKLILAPAEFYDLSNGYLIIRGVNNVFLFLNLAILAVEKAKGNTKRVFIINVMGIISKLIISLILVNNIVITLNIIGLITLMSTIVVFLLSLREYLKTSNPYKIKLKHLKPVRFALDELVKFSLPLFLSLCLFSIGKTLVNVQALKYGVEAVGYLGISNRLVGLMVGMSTGVQEGVSILLSRYREHDLSKTNFILKASVGVNIMISITAVTIYLIFFKQLMMYFANGDPFIAKQIGIIFGLELLGGILLPLTNFMNGVLYGYEKTKLVFVISFVRIIIFRNLVLFLLGLTQLGSAALGIAMFTSHVGTFLCSLLIVKHEFKIKIYKKKY